MICQKLTCENINKTGQTSSISLSPAAGIKNSVSFDVININIKHVKVGNTKFRVNQMYGVKHL